MANRVTPQKVTFGDVFAGCGGLSLGLLQAGLEGRFAIEKNRCAFATYKANLLSPESGYKFSWPKWLPQRSFSIGTVLRNYRRELESLVGKVDVLCGGPPCQGFSYAGRRKYDDPRNELFRSYLRLINIIRPRLVLIENVRGFTSDFETSDSVINYADILRNKLCKKYDVYDRVLDLSSFGVPQSRRRYFLIAVESGICTENPFETLQRRLPAFLRSVNLSAPVSAKAAISDLEIAGSGKRTSSENLHFEEVIPASPRTRYQKLMNGGNANVKDLRLARHREDIADRFRQIIDLSHAEGRLNTTLSAEMRARFGLRKIALRVLDPDRPAPTITSMPDDLLHYAEARTLTVRENARLQGFPDSFSFEGKYTTGGKRRRFEVPRFTQVANAVPPLAAKAIGELIAHLVSSKS